MADMLILSAIGVAIIASMVREVRDAWEHRRSRGCSCALIAFDYHPFDCPIHGNPSDRMT